MKVYFAQRGNIYEDDDKKAIIDLLEKPIEYNKWDVIKQFEREFSAFAGAKYALSTSSCTTALHLALKGIDIQPGDEIITTPITWVATANVIMLEKAIPIFVDVEPDTLNIDADKIEEKITAKTKAILPVHYSGHPANMDKIMDLAAHYNLPVISDAAHAIGAEHKSRRIGSFEHFAAYSFYTQKNISTLGEGGIVTASTVEAMEKIKLFQNHGIKYLSNYAGSAVLEKPWFRDCVQVGYNCRMSEGQAAVGITQLKKVERFNAIRKKLAGLYSELLKNIEGITIPNEKDYAKSSWHFYVIKIEKDFGLARDAVYHKLNELGVQTSVHYTPLHYFAPYQTLGYRMGDFPIAENAYEKILSLPLHLYLDETQVHYVVDSLKQSKQKKVPATVQFSMQEKGPVKILLASASKEIPLGLQILSTVLKKDGHIVEGALINLGDDIEKIMMAFKPDIVGFNITAHEHIQCRRLIKKLKEKFNFLCVVGGSHPTFFPEELEQDGIDIICIGEGEIAMAELAKRVQKGMDFNDIPNLHIKNNGRIVKNPVGNKIPSEQIPWADRELFIRHEDKTGPMNIMASRGCLYHCSYCFNSKYNEIYAGKGKQWNVSIKNTIEELQYLNDKYDPPKFNFHDDLFFPNKETLYLFLDEYKRKITKPFICSCRLETRDDESFEQMAKHGCEAIFVGLESGNENVRKNVLCRIISNDRIIQGCRSAMKYGINLTTHSMVGIPTTKLENDFDSIELNAEIQPHFAWVGICTPYPGTHLNTIAREAGELPDDFLDSMAPSFHDRTVLNVPHARQINYLHKIFSMAVEWPFIIPELKKKIWTYTEDDLPRLNDLWWAMRYYKHPRTTQSEQDSLEYSFFNGKRIPLMVANFLNEFHGNLN
ncbi:aminotransferase class I/II-fold pyridoxal phosphate-dependent enzyme [Candidatus Falkowbacteria bacterium]|nr:aminotransferase class I/II-fold pyridoxal phosphate-dependent enzyme [Candidatus Falkowbacteria bacterium]